MVTNGTFMYRNVPPNKNQILQGQANEVAKW